MSAQITIFIEAALYDLEVTADTVSELVTILQELTERGLDKEIGDFNAG